MNPAFPFVLALMMSSGPMALAAADVPDDLLKETSARPLQAARGGASPAVDCAARNGMGDVAGGLIDATLAVVERGLPRST